MPEKLSKETVVLSNPFETTGIDRDRAREGIAEVIGHTDSPVIAFLGTLTEQKRPSIFLRAAACLSQVIRAQFLVFGRLIGKNFRGVKDLALGDCLMSLCHEIPESLFREDISSAQLRDP